MARSATAAGGPSDLPSGPFQLLAGLVQQAAGANEAAAHGLILRVLQQADHRLPAAGVCVAEHDLDLADRLSGEQEPAARVVHDLAGDVQLVASPGQHVGTAETCRALGTENLHAGHGSQGTRAPDGTVAATSGLADPARPSGRRPA